MIKTKLKHYITSILTAATIAFALPSYASVPLHLDGLNGNLIQQVPITFDGNASTVFAGGFSGNLNGGPSSIYFCIDLRHTIGLPKDYSVNPTNPNQPTAPYLQLSAPFNQMVAASMINHADVPGFNNVDQYTALQLATWSILYNWTPLNHPTNTLGTALDLFSAPLVVDPNILNTALGFLSLAETFITGGTYSTSYGLYRMMIDAANTPENVTQTVIGVGTPEPGTYLTLASFLVLGMACMRKLKKA